jgi:hypothetical protein
MGSKPNADLSLPPNVTTPPKTQKGEEENWKVVKKTEIELKQSFFQPSFISPTWKELRLECLMRR